MPLRQLQKSPHTLFRNPAPFAPPPPCNPHLFAHSPFPPESRRSNRYHREYETTKKSPGTRHGTSATEHAAAWRPAYKPSPEVNCRRGWLLPPPPPANRKTSQTTGKR